MVGGCIDKIVKGRREKDEGHRVSGWWVGERLTCAVGVV